MNTRRAFRAVHPVHIVLFLVMTAGSVIPGAAADDVTVTVRGTLADLDGDGRNELVVGGGPDPSAATPLKVYRYDGETTVEWFAMEAYPDLELTRGVDVASGI